MLDEVMEPALAMSGGGEMGRWAEHKLSRC